MVVGVRAIAACWCCRRWGGCSWNRSMILSAPCKRNSPRTAWGSKGQCRRSCSTCTPRRPARSRPSAIPSWACVACRRHPHPRADGRSPRAGGGNRLLHRCRHVRRLRQRDRHAEGPGFPALLAQGAGGAAGAGEGPATISGVFVETDDATGLALRCLPLRLAAGCRRRCRRGIVPAASAAPTAPCRPSRQPLPPGRRPR